MQPLACSESIIQSGCVDFCIADVWMLLVYYCYTDQGLENAQGCRTHCKRRRLSNARARKTAAAGGLLIVWDKRAHGGRQIFGKTSAKQRTAVAVLQQ